MNGFVGRKRCGRYVFSAIIRIYEGNAWEVVQLSRGNISLLFLILIFYHQKDSTAQEPVIKHWDQNRDANGDYFIPYEIEFRDSKNIAAVHAALSMFEGGLF